MGDSENKKKYKSPYSVSKRQTIFLDSSDPRVKGNVSNKSATNTFNKTGENFRSVAGADIIVKDSLEPFDLKDYINFCIFDSLLVETFSSNSLSLSDNVLLTTNNNYTDDLVEVIFFDLEEIFLEENIELDNTQYYSDELTTFVPSELFEIFLSETQIFTPYVLTDNGEASEEIVTIYYEITYDGNGNDEGSAPVDVNLYQEGANVTILDGGTLTKFGYIFTSWNTQSDGSGTSYQPGDQIISINNSITLYAIYTSVYTVTYYGNNNDEGVIPVDPTLYFNGDIVTVLGQGTLVKYGSTFLGWNTLANGNGTTYQVGNTIVISNSNIALYAKWS
jgi:hypothetical protein